MIRLIGILTGSALAVAVLLLVLGVPELAESPEPVVDETEVSDVEELVQAISEAQPVAQPEPAFLPVPAPAPESRPEQDPEPELFTEAQDGRKTPAERPVEADLQSPVSLNRNSMETEQHWYAFWSPFRSQIAADGFISELSRTTGLDYRVVKLKPGIYEVAFAYSDDADIEDKLARISAATGLDMTGG